MVLGLVPGKGLDSTLVNFGFDLIEVELILMLDCLKCPICPPFCTPFEKPSS